MSNSIPYSEGYDPPAPVLPMMVSAPDRPGHRLLLRALIDTGADVTVVPAWLPSRLDVDPVDSVPVVTPSGGGRAPVHVVHVVVDGDEQTIHAVAAGEEALIGRDLLRRWVLTLDGPSRRLHMTI